MQQVRETVKGWLDTFSPVESLADKPEALSKEMETIISIFTREGVGAGVVEAVFRHIKMTLESRAWPTPAQVYAALRFVKSENNGEIKAGSQGGDQMRLSGIEKTTLHTRILPAAKKWLRQSPGLRDHAIQTLQYWGEPIEDDHGKDWTPNSKAKSKSEPAF